MNSILKGFIGIILIVVFTLAGVNVCFSALAAKNANDFAMEAASSIEDSGFSSDTIASMKSIASDNGYKDLSIDTKDCNHDGYIDMAKVVLTYEYQYHFFVATRQQEHTVTAYAR